MAKNHWKLVACYQSNLTRCSRWLKPDFWKQQPTQRALQLQCQWRKNSQLLHSSHFEAIFLTAATTSCQNVNMFRLLSLLLLSKLLSNNLDSGKSILLSPLDNVVVLKHNLQLHSANHCNQCIMYINWFMIYLHWISIDLWYIFIVYPTVPQIPCWGEYWHNCNFFGAPSIQTEIQQASTEYNYCTVQLTADCLTV